MDCIYGDPPFNKKLAFHAPTNKSERRQQFDDVWRKPTDKEELRKHLAAEAALRGGEENLFHWLDGVKAVDPDRQQQNYNYLIFMAARLVECHRILKPTGSIFLHCDDTMSHWLKLTLDVIFGEKNYRNHITWERSKVARNISHNFARYADTVLWYVKSKEGKVCNVSKPYDKEYVDKHFRYTEKGTGRRYSLNPLKGATGAIRPNLTYEFMGFLRTWCWSKERMLKALADDLVVQTKPGVLPRYKRYLDEAGGGGSPAETSGPTSLR